MKEGFRFLRVDYTITYSKALRHVQFNETEDIGYEDEDIPVARVALRRIVLSF